MFLNKGIIVGFTSGFFDGIIFSMSHFNISTYSCYRNQFGDLPRIVKASGDKKSYITAEGIWTDKTLVYPRNDLTLDPYMTLMDAILILDQNDIFSDLCEVLKIELRNQAINKVLIEG